MAAAAILSIERMVEPITQYSATICGAIKNSVAQNLCQIEHY